MLGSYVRVFTVKEMDENYTREEQGQILQYNSSSYCYWNLDSKRLAAKFALKPVGHTLALCKRKAVIKRSYVLITRDFYNSRVIWP